MSLASTHPATPVTDQFNRPARDLRLSVIDACNYRCPYCMPESVFAEGHPFMRRSELLAFDEILRLVQLCKRSLGIDKLRLTGGEPLLRPNIESLVGQLAEWGGIEDLALTTNGHLLADRAMALKQAGLGRITISLDALDPQLAARMSGGRTDMKRVRRGIQAAIEAGLAPIKLNSVIMRGVNESEIIPLAAFGLEHGVTVRFIEYMDVGNCNQWQASEVVSGQEILQHLSGRFDLEPLPPRVTGEVAQRYRHAGSDVELGLVTSISEPFCGDCNRLRLSADGRLYTCLFASQGLDLRGPLRDGASDSELQQLLAHTWQQRRDRYSELRAIRGRPQNAPAGEERQRIEMFYIGG